MIVQHNITAMNANRMLGLTTDSLSKSTEKLSSGYRINRAADDAAGLTISEKMRKQIRGLDQASTNAEDGVSAVQTAEGALTEVHSMLQRMNELATQASNGTNSESDRQAIQDEISQLTTEIDRVAETTKFNEIYLLKGDKSGATQTNTLAAHDAGLNGKLGASVEGKTTFTADKVEVGSKVTIGGTEYNIVDSSKTSDYTSIEEYTAAAGDKLVQEGKTYTYVAANATTPGGATAAAAGWFADDNTGTAADMTAKTALKEGSTLTTKADGKTTTLVGKSGTALATATTAGADPGTWAVGDVVEHDGKTYTVTKAGATGISEWKDEEGTVGKTVALVAGDKFTTKADGKTKQVDNTGISTVENIQDQIKDLADGKTVKIQKNASDTGKSYTVGVTTKEDGTKYTADDIAALVKGGMYVNDGTSTYYAVPKESGKANDITVQDAYSKMAEELKKASSIGADKEAVVKNNGDGTFEITQGTVETKTGLSFSLHVGADADMTNKINVNIDTMSATGLGIKGISVAGDDGSAATYAIDAINDAISKVSSQRSALGAVQNRLEHTIANLDNVVENTTSAESRIRDTDMAEEMVNYSKNSILQQAGQSMLAQANQANQGVLSLLQ